jgi:penicillin amidase
MSVFVRKDPRLLACADPSWPAALCLMLRRHACAAALLLLLFTGSYIANVVLGLRAAAQDSGTIAGLSLDAPVTIARDARGMPHIRASSLHDVFFAQGFAEASDRLFEMDVTRRYAYGRLAEVFGVKALRIDQNMRGADISDIAAREWQATDAQTRRALQAFSGGVNAAEKRQPLPVEFRMLLYRPQPWTPQDSIAVSLVAALELGDSWYDVLARDEKWRALSAACFDLQLPLSDPAYDVTVDGRMVRGSSRSVPGDCEGTSVALRQAQGDKAATPRPGSNAWAAGSARTVTHRALIANDPHVDLTIPGIWYAVDLQAPGFHAAGAVVPGLPGVALGHNERVAWAVTNAEVATSVVYRVANPPQRARVVETFAVRFGAPVTKTYYRTKDAFSINVDDDANTYFVRWPPYMQKSSTLPTLLALDRANTVTAAMRTLSTYRGAPQNFIAADRSGAIAYHLAGAIYDDAAWGRYVHPAHDLARPLHLIAFSDLPGRAPSRNAVLLTANNRVYGQGYAYRLSAAFEPPYRAYRIAALLHQRSRYDVAYFERMQLDTCSPIDAEIARSLARMAASVTLAGWDGCFDPASANATLEYRVRNELLEQAPSFNAFLANLRHSQPNARNGIDENARAALQPLQYPQPWGHAGQVDVEHPLSAGWYGLLRGVPLPGNGNEYTIHLQEPGFAQGFRAVWDVGNWDAGGIVLPSGESGEPGSGHYDDLAAAWVQGRLVPLAFTQRAVARSAAKKLLLLR